MPTFRASPPSGCMSADLSKSHRGKVLKVLAEKLGEVFKASPFSLPFWDV